MRHGDMFRRNNSIIIYVDPTQYQSSGSSFDGKTGLWLPMSSHSCSRPIHEVTSGTINLDVNIVDIMKEILK